MNEHNKKFTEYLNIELFKYIYQNLLNQCPYIWAYFVKDDGGTIELLFDNDDDEQFELYFEISIKSVKIEYDPKHGYCQTIYHNGDRHIMDVDYISADRISLLCDKLDELVITSGCADILETT